MTLPVREGENRDDLPRLLFDGREFNLIGAENVFWKIYCGMLNELIAFRSGCACIWKLVSVYKLLQATVMRWLDDVVYSWISLVMIQERHRRQMTLLERHNDTKTDMLTGNIDGGIVDSVGD